MIPSRFRIKRNHGCELPSSVLTIAVASNQESYPDGPTVRECPHTLRRVHCVYQRRNASGWYGKKTSTFDSGEAFFVYMRNLLQSRSPISIFSSDWHFASQLLGLWWEIDVGNFQLTIPAREAVDLAGKARKVKEWKGILAIDDSPFIVVLCSKQGTAKLLGVSNYFNMTAAELATPTSESAESYAEFNNPQHLTDRMLEKLCESVNSLMTETMMEWKTGNRGNWQPTAGSLAMSCWRHEFMPANGVEINNEVMDREYHRDGFFGGEVRNWFQGRYENEVYKVDCNSLYPAVMRGNLYPCGIKYDTKFVGCSFGELPDDPGCCMAAVTLRGEGRYPVRLEDGGVYWPEKSAATVLCGAELLDAHERGLIEKWHRWTEFTMADNFSRYVDYWWSMRVQAKATGNYSLNVLSKTMMNFLYGKFACRKSKWAILPKMASPVRWGYYLAVDPDKKQFRKYRSVAGVVSIDNGKQEREDTFPAISAFVSAAGRAYMRDVRDCMPDKTVLSQQTDAFLVNRRGWEFLQQCDGLIGNGIGQFRLVDTFEWVDMVSANQYVTNKSECISGLSLDRLKHDRWRYTGFGTAKTSEAIVNGVAGICEVRSRDYSLMPSGKAVQFDTDGWAYEKRTVYENKTQSLFVS